MSNLDTQCNSWQCLEHGSQCCAGRTLQGFRIPLGSISFFMLTMRLSELCDLEKWMYCVFLKPMPCSALTLPFSLDVHSNTNGSIIFRTSGSNSEVVMFKCRLPSPETWFINCLKSNHNHLCVADQAYKPVPVSFTFIAQEKGNQVPVLQSCQLDFNSGVSSMPQCNTRPTGPRVRHDAWMIKVKHLPQDLIIKVFDFRE